MRPCYCGADTKTQICEDIPLVLPDDCKLAPCIKVVRCSSCGFVFSDTHLIQKDYDEYYASQDFYSEPHKDFTKYVTDTYDFCKEYLGSSVLDAGCGGGQLLRYIHSKGLEVHGIDTSQACVNALLKDGIQCTLGSIFSVSNIRKYDCVLCVHVLEHVFDLNECVERLCSFVDKHLYIEVPDGASYPTDPPFQDFNTEHINHFTLGSLVGLFERNGMRCVKSWSEKKIHGNYGALCCMFTKETNGIAKYVTDSRQKLEAFIDSAPKDEPLCLYGTGQFAYKIMARLPNVKYLVDDMKCRQGKTVGGIKITDNPLEGVRVLKTF